MNSSYKNLPTDQLQPGRYQPRIDFSPEALKELAQSIQTQGLIEPLIVRELAQERYEIIAGERRWRAAIEAGLTEIPCLVGHYSDQQAATLTLVENIQRQELNLIEEATGYKRLSEEFHFQQTEIAQLVGKSRSHIANLVRLLSLSPAVQTYIRTGQISLGHARLLVGMPIAEQSVFATHIISHGWSVRLLEEKIKILKANPKQVPEKNRDIAQLECLLAEQIGSPVQITYENGQGGWLQVKFFDNDTLEGLLERMGLELG